MRLEVHSIAPVPVCAYIEVVIRCITTHLYITVDIRQVQVVSLVRCTFEELFGLIVVFNLRLRKGCMRLKEEVCYKDPQNANEYLFDAELVFFYKCKALISDFISKKRFSTAKHIAL